jgi:hypothetical protein
MYYPSFETSSTKRMWLDLACWHAVENMSPVNYARFSSRPHTTIQCTIWLQVTEPLAFRSIVSLEEACHSLQRR